VGSSAVASLIITIVGLLISVISLVLDLIPLKVRIVMASVAGAVSVIALALLIVHLPASHANVNSPASPSSPASTSPTSPASTSPTSVANNGPACVTFDVTCPALASAQIGTECQCPDGGATVTGTVHAGNPFGG
jgi:hypothetical protein